MNERDTRKIDKIKYKEKRKYFEMPKKDLEALVTQGNEHAEKELKRRAKRRRQKDKKN